ncbi:tetratricopeptide repeat-containing sensor histidine kinase [Lacibacter sp. H407]|uniref:tetratricopeptide repeat-containing sensor histidine kinase n=1 Tax=Lacibacter sp. H407 TaxID=3133423 RepID=UPI0030BEC7C8
MNRAIAICKSTMLHITGIFLLVIFPCAETNAEPIEPIPTKDIVNKLIGRINREKQDTNLVKSLLSIARYYLYAKDKASEPYIDRALTLSEKLLYKNGVIRSLCYQAAFLSFTLQDTIPPFNAIEKAIALSKKDNNIEMEAYAWYIRGLWLSNDNTNTSKQYYFTARMLYNKVGNRVKEAYVLKCIADIYRSENKLELSLNVLFEALKIYQDAGYTNLHYTYDLIGTVYRHMGNYGEALKYGFLTLKLAEERKDTVDIALFYLRIAEIYKGLNQYDEAIQFAQISLQKVSAAENNYAFLRSAASNIAGLLTISGKPNEALRFYENTISTRPAKFGSIEYYIDGRTLGDIYFSLKKYEKAENHYLHMLALKEKMYNNEYNDYFKLASYIKMADFYISQSRFKEANKYVSKASQQKTLKSMANRSAIHLQQYKIDSASANYLAAINHYQLYKTLNDSIFNEKKINQVASLQIQYETEKKEKDIIHLIDKNKQQQIKLRERLFERNMLIAGAIMLALLLWLSINRYLIKQKSNRQLLSQQEIIKSKNEILNSLIREKEDLLQLKDKLIAEKEWLIKEVHHRVKNNLQMVCTLLYTQANYLTDEKALAAINEGQQRIQAISLIHQKLYQSDNLQLVNMKSYVHELVDYLKDSFTISKDIEFNLLIDSIELDISRSIPVGLILNEAITNSLKYAFQNGKRKIISIQLQRKHGHKITLLIKDNGKGLPDNYNPLYSNTLGINMMQGLSKQINADFSMSSENGTVIIMEFEEASDL